MSTWRHTVVKKAPEENNRVAMDNELEVSELEIKGYPELFFSCEIKYR